MYHLTGSRPQPTRLVLVGVLVGVLLILPACSGLTFPIVPIFDFHLSHVTSTFGRGGRAVAVDVDPADARVAIAGAEQGGLFRTDDGGRTWTHLDALPVPNIIDARFVPADASGRTLVVTGGPDSRVRNDGGIWVSADGGASWSHVALPAPCSGPRYLAGQGIGFDPRSADVLVGTGCGLVISHDVASRGGQASWSMLFPFPTVSVVVDPSPGPTIIDACANGPSGRGLYLIWAPSIFTFASSRPDCQSVHSIAVSPVAFALPPFPRTDIFATSGTTVIQSHDRGATWTDLMAAPNNSGTGGRPIWVRIEQTSTDTLSLYAPGEVESCTRSPSITNWSCPINGWAYVPASSNNHDINDIAFSPTGTCPQFMALDFGVLGGDPPGTTTCSDGSAWPLTGTDAAGFHALQIYDIAGQLHWSISQFGWITPLNTNLYIATQDNHAQYSPDGGRTWQDLASNDDFYLQSPLVTVGGDPDRSGVTFATCCKIVGPPLSVIKAQQTGNALGTSSTWPLTSAGCNGLSHLSTQTPPTLIAAGQYVEWSADSRTLFLSTDDGCMWTAVATLPTNISNPNFIMQVSEASSTNPIIYDVAVVGSSLALIKISGIKNPSTGAPQTGSVAPLPGSVQPELSDFCLGYKCPTAYGVDPANANHLIAADLRTQQMVVTTDGGMNWAPNTQLTQLVTAYGTVIFNVGALTQARVIAFDPLQPNLVLVGTKQAGIIASTDGGQTWSTIPLSQQLVNITSFFFDDQFGVVYVGTFSSGLWRFNWTNSVELCIPCQ